MSQNYNYSNGIVGKWHGLPVYVIKESEFFNRRFSPEATTIYALSKGDNGDLELVLKDTLIGTMTPEGTVSDCNPPMPFERFPNKNKSKGKNKSKDKDKSDYPVETSMEDINVEDLYKLSAPIDAFLAQAAERDWFAVG